MRSYGKVLSSIWDDAEFCALTCGEQRLYLMLISSADMSICGVIPLRPRRWAQKATGISVGGIEAAISGLEAAMFIVTDDVEGELLVRTFMRHDGVLAVPNQVKSAHAAFRMVTSERIRATLSATYPGVFEGEETCDSTSGNPSGNPSGNGMAIPVALSLEPGALSLEPKTSSAAAISKSLRPQPVEASPLPPLKLVNGTGPIDTTGPLPDSTPESRTELALHVLVAHRVATASARNPVRNPGGLLESLRADHAGELHRHASAGDQSPAALARLVRPELDLRATLAHKVGGALLEAAAARYGVILDDADTASVIGPTPETVAAVSLAAGLARSGATWADIETELDGAPVAAMSAARAEWERINAASLSKATTGRDGPVVREAAQRSTSEHQAGPPLKSGSLSEHLTKRARGGT